MTVKTRKHVVHTDCAANGKYIVSIVKISILLYIYIADKATLHARTLQAIELQIAYIADCRCK